MLILPVYDDHLRPRDLSHLVSGLLDDGIAILPTDTNYAAVSAIAARRGVQRLYDLKSGKKQRRYTLLCADLKDISRYAQVDNQAYRFMRSLVPGPYTFILPASREVPKMVLTKRRTVGVRVPDSGVCQTVITELDAALLAASARDDEGEIIGTVDGLSRRYGHLVDFLADAGEVISESSTIIDLTASPPELVRQGKGPLP